MNEKILIVEDEFIVADDLQLTLKHAGYRVCGIAGSVVEAREIIAREKPALVLLDIHLKGKLNGIELARELREDNIAFIYLSANSNQQILEAAKATDPYGFLVKPYREKDLLVTIDIARYRHEHSLESKLRKEAVLQKQLVAISREMTGWEQKLLKMAAALQAYIPFDFLSAGMKSAGDQHFSGCSFLRIGFDQYQSIGVHELEVISGIRADEIKMLQANTPVDRVANWYNADAFKKIAAGGGMKGLFAKTFEIASNLEMPLLVANGNIFSLILYSRNPEAYNDELLELICRLQQPLSAIVDSILANERIDAFSNSKISEKQTAEETQVISNFEGIIGSSPSLLNVLDLVTQVAPLDTSVLILGESGTGKERIADCIHKLSTRKDNPIVKVNCAALPATLIESELFGHEKGAFTGATDRRIGKFELADKGTIFLDEIGEMPPELQVKLLRVLQEKEIERVGGKHIIKVDVRVIAATNRKLEEEVAAGRFRLDLYYRLNVFPVYLPSLRERKEDIRQLAHYFGVQFCHKFKKTFSGISHSMLAELEANDWPGNIRELENIMEQTVILNDGKSELVLRRPLEKKIPGTKASLPLAGTVQSLDDIKEMQRQAEKEYISTILQKTKGRVRGKGGAAELLNQKPTTLESRMMKLGIRKDDFT